jgi:L,D-transpeptidase catalytic domain
MKMILAQRAWVGPSNAAFSAEPTVGGKDTQYRIHGTNQPEYIGQAISSGCIRMTNEDAIDLYNRVKIGTIVVVLPPTQYWPFSLHTVVGRPI